MTVSYELLRQHFQGKVYRENTAKEYFAALCPFHDDRSPSLMVYMGEPMDGAGTQHHGHWRCLACDRAGGLDSIWRKAQGWTPPTADTGDGALHWHPPALPSDLEEQESLVNASHSVLLNHRDRGWYLAQRGVDNRIEPCRLGYFRGWITIPVYEQDGRYKGVILRSTPPIQAIANTRFHQPKGQHGMPYVPDWSLVRGKIKLAVVFGMFDALTMAELMIPAITATAGNQGFNPMWFKDYQKKKIFVIPDQPDHEIAPARKLVEALMSLGIDARLLILKYPDGIKDPNGFFERGMKPALVNQLAGVLL